MATISAKDVKALRDSTGAGMMDAKRALVENDGDPALASAWLRERGLGKAAERSGRENAEGAVAVAITPDGTAAAIVELKSETDFGPSHPSSSPWSMIWPPPIAAEGEQAGLANHADAVDDLKVTGKENIDLGTVTRFEAPAGHVLNTYLHVQNGRGVNGVLVELEGGTAEQAHDVAVHIAFGRPAYLRRTMSPPTRSPPSVPLSKRRPATRANPKQPCRRSSRASSPAGSSGYPVASCSSSPTPRTTRSTWPPSSATSRSSALPRL